MGHNFYFAFTFVLAGGIPWQTALGAVALAGMLFVITAGIGLRERLITVIPSSLKHAIAVSIGLLIAMVGLQWAGVIVDSPGTLVTLGDLRTTPVMVALTGFTVMAVLSVWNFRSALLVGLLVVGIVAWLTGVTEYQGFASLPPSIGPTFLEFDLWAALQADMAAVILVFPLLALFDSVGTLVGVAEQAGLMQDGVLPLARGALRADAVGTVVGAGFGHIDGHGLCRERYWRGCRWSDRLDGSCDSGSVLSGAILFSYRGDDWWWLPAWWHCDSISRDCSSVDSCRSNDVA